MSELNERQRRFTVEYVKDFNGTQAAIRAGYAQRGAAVTASQHLTNPKIQALIAEHVKAREVRAAVTQDRVVQELARIAFADIRNVMTWDGERTRFKASDELDDDAARTIALVKERVTRNVGRDGEVTYLETRELKLYDKLKALEMLGRHLGMFNDKLQIDVLTQEARQIVEDLARTVDVDAEAAIREFEGMLRERA